LPSRARIVAIHIHAPDGHRIEMFCRMATIDGQEFNFDIFDMKTECSVAEEI
jgi:hypothetical protein